MGLELRTDQLPERMPLLALAEQSAPADLRPPWPRLLLAAPHLPSIFQGLGKNRRQSISELCPPSCGPGARGHTVHSCSGWGPCGLGGQMREGWWPGLRPWAAQLSVAASPLPASHVPPQTPTPWPRHLSTACPGARHELLPLEEVVGREQPQALSHPEALGHQPGTHRTGESRG